MGQLILFTGGARSGKSRRAEQYAAIRTRFSGAANVVYVATAEAGDDEMRRRIDLHRAGRPAAWRTIEATAEIGARLRDLPAGTTVLLDCLSLLVSNLLLANEADPAPVVEAEIDGLLAAAERGLNLIIVTNEVGMGLVPEYPLGRAYRDLLGRAAQRIAAAADEVYLVVAGIPVELRQLAAASAPWATAADEGAR